MKCPKCHYSSFPYLETCAKCGHLLTEQRAAMGLYGLQPEPPDLWLAYQVVNSAGTGVQITAPLTAPGLDFPAVAGIDLDVSETEPRGQETGELETAAGALSEPTTDRPSGQDADLPPGLASEDLIDMTLTLEDDAERDAAAQWGPQITMDRTNAEQVYDLDAAGDLGDLSLGSLVDEAGADQDSAEAVEYVLEIEEDLEFEVEERGMAQDEAGEAEDDDRL
jgi:hypothetical protein